jgi:hypothetical protein
MNRTSLIVWSPDDVETAYKVIDDFPWQIQRVKFWSERVMWKKPHISVEQILESRTQFADMWVDSYIWGWLVDACIKQEARDWKPHFNGISDQLVQWWFETVEIWNPTLEQIGMLRDKFQTVIAEIWSKSTKDEYGTSYLSWEQSLERSVNVWIKDIVIEWWGESDRWIYSIMTEVKMLLLMSLMRNLEDLSYDWDVVIEANAPLHQRLMYQSFGGAIHLWNISPQNCYEESYFWPDLKTVQEKYWKNIDGRASDFFAIIAQMEKVAAEKKLDLHWLYINQLIQVNWPNIQDVIDECQAILEWMRNMSQWDEIAKLGHCTYEYYEKIESARGEL